MFRPVQQISVHLPAKRVQDGAEMRPRHEKMSPIIVAIAVRFAAFAKNVLMKQVLDTGRTGRREKTPKCGHCECAGGQDGFQNGVQEVAKTVQDGAKMRPRREKMSPRIVAIAGRFAAFAKNVFMKQVLPKLDNPDRPLFLYLFIDILNDVYHAMYLNNFYIYYY